MHRGGAGGVARRPDDSSLSEELSCPMRVLEKPCAARSVCDAGADFGSQLSFSLRFLYSIKIKARVACLHSRIRGQGFGEAWLSRISFSGMMIKYRPLCRPKFFSSTVKLELCVGETKAGRTICIFFSSSVGETCGLMWGWNRQRRAPCTNHQTQSGEKQRQHPQLGEQIAAKS